MSETTTLADAAASAAKIKPTILVPPRGSMEYLFPDGFSPGPMTLVSSLFSDQSTFSFSQLLAGAMASPSPMAPKPPPSFLLTNNDHQPGGKEEEEDKVVIQDDEDDVSESGYKRNRPVNLVVTQPQQQLLESLSPLFMVPSGFSPSGLLNSPAFFSPLQSPFGMSHQQALAHVTAQAALSKSYMQMQAELQSSPSETLTQQTSHMTTEPEILMIESSEVSQPERKPASVTGDKPVSDGYNWRKYGQKNVKGSECPRSYYKCTYVSCSVKKKVERSFDGSISEITYKGQHNHDLPQPNKRGKDSCGLDRTNSGPTEMNKLNKGVHVVSEPVKFLENTQYSIENIDEREEAAIVLDDGDDDEPIAKRRSLDAEPSIQTSSQHIEPSIRAPSQQTITESKIVVQTRSEVDLLDDGYKWRKYGQKVVKGNRHPRSYYKCTYAGCGVRKHVERASEDPKAVITTYEGKHDHEIPAGRYSNHSTVNANTKHSKSQKAAKSRAMKEMDFENKDRIPITLQLKEEQIAAS